MFKKLKDKIEEEFKQAPLKFPVSVQQLAQVISPSQSVNSLSDNNASSSLTYPTDMPNVSTDFFSIGGDDDPQEGVTKMPLTLHNVDLSATSPSNMTHSMSRSRRSSISSVTSEASSLFPIYEGGLNQNFLQSDLESEMEDGMSGQIEKISKEQLYQSFKKILNRYNKYKGRYTDLMKHYKELQHDNFKTKNVLQESQDKALRRVAELREQCQLEQKAKAHLEESLRNDMEERDHIIDTLKTKISLLSSGTDSGQLIDFESDSAGSNLENNSQSKELWHLKSQNENLQKEVERLKKIKETACHLIHRCDTTINEATEDVQSDNLKQKMAELKSEIQKMKSENESLSHLLSRNIMTEDDRKCVENSLICDLSSLESSQGNQKMDEKDKKIEKLNNLLLKCKEKINSLNAEIKAKNLIIEDNNKKLKELKDEIGTYKVREEENALSVAENKKAIHEELNSKEEQIKALTKELKTKENEYIKEKAEVVKKYEDKIQDLTMNLSKEIKAKMEQNQKLMEDLKAKEIVSRSLDKVNAVEDSFMKMLEFVKNRSFAFEEFVQSKAVEIEIAQQKLEDRVTAAQKNLTQLVQKNKRAKAVEQVEAAVQQKLSDSQSELGNPNAEAPESFHIVEKLKLDVINLSKKLEILETDLEESRRQVKAEREDKDKWKDKYSLIEIEREKIKNDFQEKLNENTQLGKVLNERNEKIEKVEKEKKLLQKVSSEKVETESKLREYIENYNKLEKENRTLQNDLVEKCGKLLKELNDNKEKIKHLESQDKAKANELETFKNQYSVAEIKKSEENERLRTELEKTKKELENIRSESEKMMTIVGESEKTKGESEGKDEKIRELETELGKSQEKARGLESDVEKIRKEMSHEKRSSESIRNELEALRNNLKGELKEKDEKSILVDKLTHECNLLMAEIENLKKTHGKVEKKLESDLENTRQEVLDRSSAVDKLQQELAAHHQEKEEKSREADALAKKCESLAEEVEMLKGKQGSEEVLKKELISENERTKKELMESEALRKNLNERILELTKEKNEAFGELQMKLNETEALKTSLKSLREDLAEKVRSHEEEKARLLSENDNRLAVLKNEIQFINRKHEEDLGNFEDNLNTEMKEVSEKMETAEKASAELLEKLERITNEREELKVAEEEKNLKISELESCLLALKTELNEKFNDVSGEHEDDEIAAKHGEEIKQIIMQYDREIAERDEEIETLKLKLSGMNDDDANDEEAENKHREEVKQIIMQYDKEIAERDEEIDSLKSKLSDADDDEESNNKHGKEVKQIIMQYDTEIAERDEEIESLKSKLSGYDDALEHLKAAKEEVKMLRKELAEKESSPEKKLEEMKDLKSDGDGKRDENGEALERKVVRLEEILARQTAEHRIEVDEMKAERNRALEEEKRKWEGMMTGLKKKYEKETEEWSTRKKNVDTEKRGVIVGDGSPEEVELECTSKVAMAALESGSSSLELLQKQLIQQAAEMKEIKKQHKREIIDLKKMSSSKRRSRRNSTENQDWFSGGLENDTEHEYLRNILYEYMMGKEQLVLAKVLSAIVKFNEEQTNNVLEKEQQRQTLFGQLGLL